MKLIEVIIFDIKGYVNGFCICARTACVRVQNWLTYPLLIFLFSFHSCEKEDVATSQKENDWPSVQTKAENFVKETSSTTKKLALEGWILADSKEFYFKFPTEEELEVLRKKGITIGLDVEKRNTCQWSDGQYGSIDCSGGTCKVVWVLNHSVETAGNTPDQVDVCLKCSESPRPGACRP